MTRKLKYIIAVNCTVILLLLLVDLFSQEPAYIQYTEQDGLPSSEVYHVFQDSKGYIWFATDNGVSRYNGTEFENFGLVDGLPDLTVFEIYEDYKARIWFITLSCKLSYFFDGEIHKYKHNNLISDISTSVNGSVKYGFYIDSAETTYFSLDADGLLKIFDNGKLERISLDNSENAVLLKLINDTTSLLVRRNSFVRNLNVETELKSSNSGISFCKIEALNEKFFLRDSLNKIFKHTNSISINKNDQYFLSANNTLININKASGLKYYSFSSDIVGLYIDSESNLWVGTLTNGVFAFDEMNINRMPDRHYLNGKTVTSIMQDDENGYWFSTYRNGVFFAPSLSVCVAGNENNKRYSSIAICDELLYAVDKDNNQVSSFDEYFISELINIKHGREEIVNAVYSKENEVFVGTPYGIYNVSSHKWIDASIGFGSVTDIFKKGDSLYCAINFGYYILENEKIVFSSLHKEFNTGRLFSKRINAIYPYSGGVYLGCIDGLWNKRDTIFEKMENENSIFQNRVLSIDAAINESFFCAVTKGAGILVFNDDLVVQINEDHGLASNIINSVKILNNNLLVGTNKGLNIISFINDDFTNYSIRYISKRNGLSSNVINDIAIKDSTIYLASDDGICYYNMNQLKQNIKAPPIYLTSIKTSNSDTILNNKIELPYNKNQIRISYNGLTYKSNGEIGYEYRLLGASKSWVSESNNYVFFNNLQPGKYTFQVKAANEEGVWSTKPAEISFVIKPPFWKTWWFISIEIIVFLLIVIISFMLWYRVQAKRNKMNTDLIKIRQQALGSQMNPHFIFNSLNSIQNYILQNDKITSQKYLSDFASLMRKVLMNSQNATISLAEELSALKLYIQLEEVRFQGKFKSEISINKEVNTNNVLLPPLMLQPFVENAIWHGLMPKQENGILYIKIESRNNNVVCVIEDNGVGRKKAADIKKSKMLTYKSMGSNITQKRLNLFNLLHKTNMRVEYIDLTNNLDEALGTRVEFYLPTKID